ncbi:DUF3300 domain-containing protein [Phyllobacterium endophyticum]|uniref:DUF3300 domain-containing protein n=1 Tax=Phyllobacterium endophyticum TaxID=1149773 RepID=UPI0011C826A6|nr:DUF3300 domain-containing protein [Phyllobacterium endophyticum]TXR47089.1 DUF3300 domain-containing protein [Phyllobacterium endophyticum]
MSLRNTLVALATSAVILLCPLVSTSLAQTQPAAAPSAPAQERLLLTADEVETLVARIALYPDDLVALVLSAAVNPLQIVQAARFNEQVKTKTDKKPDPNWDGSIVSLLNYPSVLTMMNDDLDWTEKLGEAIVNQQKDVLVAIQQLRDKAVSDGVIKSDDEVIVEIKNDNVVIRPVKQEVTYVPSYDPAILTNPTYVADAPITYGDPYPSYYYPYAPYWSGFVRGAVWGAAVDWDNWHSWGGDDIDIDVNNFNRDDFKFDRNNIGNLNIDRNNFRFDKDSISNNLRQNNANRLDHRASRQAARPAAGLAGTGSKIQSSEIRRDVQQGLKQKGSGKGQAADRMKQNAVANRQNASKGTAANLNRSGKAGGQLKNVDRPSKKAAGRIDNRPRQPSALGNYSPGRETRIASQRGHVSRQVGGGSRVGHGGGGPRIAHRGGGGRAGHGGGRGGRGGGGRGR